MRPPNLVLREIPVSQGTLERFPDEVSEEDEELRDRVCDAVEALDPELRNVVELLMWGQMSQREAGDALGITRGEVRQRWNRAIGLLEVSLRSS